MSKQDVIEIEGTVMEALPNAMFNGRATKWPYNSSSYFR